jgi:hypothetical protein
MVQLTRRQRQAVVALAMANVIALIGVGAVLLRGHSRPDDTFLATSLAPQQSEACREAVSHSLFDAGQSGLVHIEGNGTILIEIQRELTTDTLRLDADAATWAALEAVANGGECRRLKTVHVNVLFSSPHQGNSSADDRCQELLSEASSGSGACKETRTMARVGIVDVMTWSVGAMDDEELARRVDYQVPGAPSPAPEDTTALP